MERVETFDNQSTSRLWGQHTIEIAHIHCPIHLLPDSNDVKAKVLKDTNKSIKSNAMIMVGEHGIFIVLMNDPRESVVDMIRMFRKGLKYFIRFDTIVDVIVSRLDGVEISSTALTEPASLVTIYFKGRNEDGKLIVIYFFKPDLSINNKCLP